MRIIAMALALAVGLVGGGCGEGIDGPDEGYGKGDDPSSSAAVSPCDPDPCDPDDVCWVKDNGSAGCTPRCPDGFVPEMGGVGPYSNKCQVPHGSIAYVPAQRVNSTCCGPMGMRGMIVY